jgi:hypothetical protein
MAIWAVGTFFVAVPVHTEAAQVEPWVTHMQVAQSGVYGPYATMRRANEMANYFRSLGYEAIAYHNGDGYYVSVR